MPTMQDSVSVPANSVSVNQLSGRLYENMPAPGAVVLSALGSVTGLKTTFLVGGVALLEDEAIGDGAGFPKIPDDILTQEGVPAGAKLILKFRNPTGAAIVARWRVDVSF